MINYRIQIIGDKYPKEFLVSASNWGTAAARAIREWKKTSIGKGSRTKELTLKIIKGNKVLTNS